MEEAKDMLLTDAVQTALEFSYKNVKLKKALFFSILLNIFLTFAVVCIIIC